MDTDNDLRYFSICLTIIVDIIATTCITAAAFYFQNPKIMVLILGNYVLYIWLRPYIGENEQEEIPMDVEATMEANGFILNRNKNKDTYVKSTGNGTSVCIEVDKEARLITTWIITADGRPAILPLPENYLYLLNEVMKWI